MKHDQKSGAAAVGLLGAAIGLVFVTGLLGTSAATAPVPGGPGWLPPYNFGLDPSPWLVTGLLLGAAVLGAVGLLAALRALKAGWSPDPRRLTVAGAGAAVGLILVPPMGSADHLVYAAYGRLAATGGNPYSDTALTLAQKGDPVGLAVEAPWTDTPSVYGPVATAEQWLAAQLGGASAHSIVLVLTLIGAASFVAINLLLQRTAGSREEKARIALLWGLNPLLLFVGVNAAHLDTFAVLFAVAALVAVRRSPVLAGVLVGLACAAKVSLGLYVLALAWGLRKTPKAVAAMVGSAAVVGVLTYLPVGTTGFDQMRENSKLVSLASPLRTLVHPFESMFEKDTARSLIGLLGWVLAALLAWFLARRVPRTQSPDAAFDGAVRAASVLTVAWLLTAPYNLPWYDLAAWAPLVLLGASGLDKLLLARTLVMVCAYVPGRVVPLPDALEGFQKFLRGTVGPIAGWALIVGAVWFAVQSQRRDHGHAEG